MLVLYSNVLGRFVLSDQREPAGTRPTCKILHVGIGIVAVKSVVPYPLCRVCPAMGRGNMDVHLVVPTWLGQEGAQNYSTFIPPMSSRDIQLGK